MGEFGDKFRKAREKKELSFDDVSNVTKISSRMLRAIEEEHFDQLPGGVFNKGFIRAYAKHLGLNDEEAVTDYLACLHSVQIAAQEVWQQPERPAQPRYAAAEGRRQSDRRAANPPAFAAQPPAQVEDLPGLQLPRPEDARPPLKKFAAPATREIPWRIVAIAAVVLVLGLILWTRRSHNTNAAASDSSPAKPSQTALPDATTTPSTNQPSAGLPASGSPAATSSTPNVPSSQPLASGNHPPASTPATPSSSNDTNDNNDVTVRTSSAKNPPPSAKAPPSLTLVIRANETSWISVLADGQTVSQETLIAPAHASVHASREIVARIGNAAGVTFLWNGKEIPADGAESEVKTFVFDSDGMRVLPSSQTPP